MLDAGGNITLTGRAKDVINRGGVKYNPLDIEHLLDAHPRVVQSAIVPVPDPFLGERACAFVVPAGDVAPSLGEFCAYLLAQGIAKLKLPERLELIEEMPLTATRKIIKGRLVPKGGRAARTSNSWRKLAPLGRHRERAWRSCVREDALSARWETLSCDVTWRLAEGGRVSRIHKSDKTRPLSAMWSQIFH